MPISEIVEAHGENIKLIQLLESVPSGQERLWAVLKEYDYTNDQPIDVHFGLPGILNRIVNKQPLKIEYILPKQEGFVLFQKLAGPEDLSWVIYIKTNLQEAVAARMHTETTRLYSSIEFSKMHLRLIKEGKESFSPDEVRAIKYFFRMDLKQKSEIVTIDIERVAQQFERSMSQYKNKFKELEIFPMKKIKENQGEGGGIIWNLDEEVGYPKGKTKESGSRRGPGRIIMRVEYANPEQPTQRVQPIREGYYIFFQVDTNNQELKKIIYDEFNHIMP